MNPISKVRQRQADRSAGRQVGTLIIYLTEEKAISNCYFIPKFYDNLQKKTKHLCINNNIILIYGEFVL